MAASMLSGFVTGFVYLAPGEVVWMRESDPDKVWWHYMYLPKAFR
jgi:hypothetical protein